MDNAGCSVLRISLFLESIPMRISIVKHLWKTYITNELLCISPLKEKPVRGRKI